MLKYTDVFIVAVRQTEKKCEVYDYFSKKLHIFHMKLSFVFVWSYTEHPCGFRISV